MFLSYDSTNAPRESTDTAPRCVPECRSDRLKNGVGGGDFRLNGRTMQADLGSRLARCGVRVKVVPSARSRGHVTDSPFSTLQPRTVSLLSFFKPQPPRWKNSARLARAPPLPLHKVAIPSLHRNAHVFTSTREAPRRSKVIGPAQGGLTTCIGELSTRTPWPATRLMPLMPTCQPCQPSSGRTSPSHPIPSHPIPLPSPSHPHYYYYPRNKTSSSIYQTLDPRPSTLTS
ncbi:hypothetical protein N431DRAFT_144994 [Stipitochalara longipes BDJ]|nr:hypothetical protein N431DRAFT_144994 [Stipitochalara longipes BDJ]